MTLHDVVVVGAGPSGLMAAITCAEAGLRTLAIDGSKALGAKLLVSGGGRCNITNLHVSEKDYQTAGPRIVRNILQAFPPERTLEFFKELGVEMVLEERTKYFPKEQSAKRVLQALLQASHHAGVVIERGKKVKIISKAEGIFCVSGDAFEFFSKALVIATGGLSYPGTGSDGSGFLFAKSLGHSIVPTAPALTPLITDDLDWKRLAGITLPVEILIAADRKIIGRSEGAFLFTHIGFSGPAVLDISGRWLQCDAQHKELIVNFLPMHREADINNELARQVAAHAGRSWKRALSAYFPERFVEAILKRRRIDSKTRLDQIAKKSREALIHFLFHCPVNVTGSQGYEKAEVTSGGVDIREVNAKTLESKVCARLFFAGEVLDVDGKIGGFNFQWAWASGNGVGRAIVREFKADPAYVVKT